jgi:hypothetical protein
MSTLEQWLDTQAQPGRLLYLVLDADGQLDERNALANELGPDRYRNLYIGTPAESLTNIGPYLFQLASLDHPVVQALLKRPERHWGWLASAAETDLDAITTHWQERLVTAERQNQALYRLHDNRVLGRALAYLRSEQYPEYLGPMISVCYWQAQQWTVTDNPNPGMHPLPSDPAWLKTPAPEAIFASVQFDNSRRYLMSEHTDALADLAEQQEVDTWLRAQLDLAGTWGWHTPGQVHFLLTQSLQASGYLLPRSWLPRPNENTSTRFDRVYQEVRYWQGEGPV